MNGIRWSAWGRKKRAAVVAAALVCLGLGPAFGLPAKPPKPDLHAGGATPSSIPNDATTLVTLPGFHFTGAQIETGDICAVVSYQVVSDNKIEMQIMGKRPVAEKESQCTITVRTAGGAASTWIVVELTEDEQTEADAQERAADAAKAQAFQKRAGTKWLLNFAGGLSETYTSTGVNPDGIPTFQTGSGGEARIAVANDNTVLILEGGCMRAGKLAGDKVSDGQSRGNCAPDGAWTATVMR